jgi:uncharacterized membrane protein
MRLLFEPVWSWPAVILTAVALIAVVLVTYPKRIRHLPAGQRRLLLGLRLLAAGLIIMALLRPGVRYSDTDRRDAVLLVMADASRSMTTPDGPGGVTRRQQLLTTLKESEGQFADLSDSIETRYYDFNDKLAPVPTPLDTTGGMQTAMGYSLNELQQEIKSGNVLSVLLLADGAQNGSGVLDVDPRAAARTFGQLQVPIYTVAYGGTDMSSSSVDLSVEDVDVQRVVFEKNLVPVGVRVKANGATDKQLTVRLYLEDRSGVRLGDTGPMKAIVGDSTTRPMLQITPKRSSETLRTQLSFIPERPGEYKLGVEVEAIDGELKVTNNRMETIISVRKGGIRVAYFDQLLRPEQKFIRRINVAQKIQLDYQPVLPWPRNVDTPLEDDWFRGGAYDVYIIGDVAAEVFGKERLANLSAQIEQGAGLIMIGGSQSFGPGGYGSSPLERWLPVEMQAGGFANNVPARTAHHERELKMQPTSAGLKHFVMQIDADGKNSARWDSLAPLAQGNRLKPKRGGLVQTLAETPDGIPLLMAHDVGGARVAAFAGDTTWLWVSRNEDLEAHQRFWRQMILWLAHKEFDDESQVWVKVEPRNFAPGQKVPIEYGARGEDKQPLDDVTFKVQITNPAKETFDVPTLRGGDSRFTSDFTETMQPGDYLVHVAGTRNGQPFGPGAYTRFIVDSRDAELDNPAADHKLLEEIAELSGGDSLTPEQLSERLQAWVDKGIPNLEMTRVSRINLWDNWPFLICFVSVMSLEWFFRKRRGLV